MTALLKPKATEHAEQKAETAPRKCWRKPKNHNLSSRPEYNSWVNMKARCHNQNHPRYAEWGGRGIKVCDEWLHDFEAFFNDMGPRPEGTNSLDRIDSSKGYCKSNCRWANAQTQSENRPTWIHLIEYNGETRTLSAWAKHLGVCRASIRLRIKKGWTPQEAVSIPFRVNGEPYVRTR